MRACSIFLRARGSSASRRFRVGQKARFLLTSVQTRSSSCAKISALCHLEENAQVICGGSLAALGTQSGRFDIIFLDPPYESGLLEQAMEKIAQFDILSPHGIMVAESPQNQTLPELPAPYGLYREYRYGKIKVSIYHRAVEEEA